MVTFATSDKKSVLSPATDSKLSKLADTFPIKLSAQASAGISVFPKVDDADILSSPLPTFLVTGDSCVSAVESPDSLDFNVPFGAGILSVYPVNGTNPIDSEGKSCETSFVLEKAPNITGCCAVSPSRKNPITTSPGLNATDAVKFAPPVPDVEGSIIFAQGKSSSAKSAFEKG